MRRTRLLTAAIALSLMGQVPPMSTPAPLWNEPGLAIDPAVSSDGRWLAFASDRGGSGFLHIWLRPFGGGQARQLTAGLNDDREPVFSPDGSMLAFRGEANGGGIYAIAVASGE